MREGAPLTLYRVHAALAAELRAIQRHFRIPVIASKHVLFPGGQVATGEGPGGVHGMRLSQGRLDRQARNVCMAGGCWGGGFSMPACPAIKMRQRHRSLAAG